MTRVSCQRGSVSDGCARVCMFSILHPFMRVTNVLLIVPASVPPERIDQLLRQSIQNLEGP